ncbi:MAG: leishmanolysin-related zinc metalloendopeptidase [Gemmatimonadales bacterium]
MLLSRRVVAGALTRASHTTRRLTAPCWAVLLGSISACGTDPRIPTTVTLSSSAVSFTALGQTQQLFPAVSDQDGKPLAGADVSWTSSNTGLATVSASGVVTAVGAGTADITARSGSATATVQVTVVQTPTQLLKVSGDAQTSAAGTVLPAPLVVQLNDAGGSPIPGSSAAFAVTQGDGTTSAATVVTGSDGRASATFTTGTASGSPQAVSVSIAATALSVSFTATAASDPTSFNIGLRYLSSATPAQRQAFTDARLKWQSAITGDLEDGPLQAGAGTCGAGSPAINQDIDDVVILVSVVPMDGPGGTLATAGPCWIRDPGFMPILGRMRLDIADLSTIEAEGQLSTVILHEMGHVLGIGSLWPDHGLLAGPSLPPANGTDPHFTGIRATKAFNNVGGTAYVGGAKVPVENIGGRGTADGHWRESEFGSELMTGFINAGQNPLSVVSLASLGDEGYAVNLATADAYSLMLSLRAFDTRPKLRLQNDILGGPITKVDRRGRVTGELRR